MIRLIRTSGNRERSTYKKIMMSMIFVCVYICMRTNYVFMYNESFMQMYEIFVNENSVFDDRIQYYETSETLRELMRKYENKRSLSNRVIPNFPVKDKPQTTSSSSSLKTYENASQLSLKDSDWERCSECERGLTSCDSRRIKWKR